MNLFKRIIARLDIKGPDLVKGIHLEGLRVLGNPNFFAKEYYNDLVDELIYQDVVASLYQRNNLLDIVNKTSKNIFIPLTVGGGIKSIDDIQISINEILSSKGLPSVIYDPNTMDYIMTRSGETQSVHVELSTFLESIGKKVI